jgi:MIP family channel proteins
MAEGERAGTRQGYADRGLPQGALGAAVVAEVVGTFMLVFLGCGSIGVVVKLTGDTPAAIGDIIAVSITFGLAVSAAIYALGHVSGAHINPAITIALTAVRKFPVTAAGLYIVAQIVGAVLASLALWAIFGSSFRDAGLGGTEVGDGVSTGGAILSEAITTFILMIVVMGTATDDRADSPAVGIGVGFVVAALVFATAPISNSALNPARALGPMIVTGTFSDILVYIIGPVVGALAAAFLYEFVLRPGSPPEMEGALEEEPKDVPPTPARAR